MSTPKSSSAYPRQMLQAIRHAITHGELVIPTSSPGNLMLQYSGLRGALRRENSADEIDMVSFYKDKDAGTFTIRLKENTDYAKDLERAMSGAQGISPALPSAVEDAESALDRILNGTPKA